MKQRFYSDAGNGRLSRLMEFRWLRLASPAAWRSFHRSGSPVTQPGISY